MALVAGRTQIGLRETGSSVSVPSSASGLLMYYLDCICSVLDWDDDPEMSRLRQFQHDNLTRSQKERLFVLCTLLNPVVLIDKCIFHNVELCRDSQNQFFELSAVQTHLAAMEHVVIGGQTRRVRKIMVFKMVWLQENWREPMEVLKRELERPARVMYLEPARYSPSPSSAPSLRQPQSSCCIIL